MNTKQLALFTISLLVVVGGLALLLTMMSNKGESSIEVGPESEGPESDEPEEPEAVETGEEAPPPEIVEEIETKDGSEDFVEKEILEGDDGLVDMVIMGTVLDKGTGDGVAGAQFKAVLSGNVPGTFETSTDEKGAFHVAGRGHSAAYNWTVTKEGYAEARGRFIYEEEMKSMEVGPVELSPGGTLTGSVHVKGGSPLEGAQILIHILEQTEEGLSYPVRSVTYSAHSDEDGAYENAALPAGRFRVIAQAEGYARKMEMGVVVKAGDRSKLDFELQPEAELSGTVRDGEGKAVAGATIDGTYQGKEGQFEIPTAVTDEDGTFEVSHLPPGRVNLKADAQGHGSQIRIGVPIPSTGVEFTLGVSSGVIEGTVKGPGGPLDTFEVKYYEEKPGNYQLAAVAILGAKTENFEKAGGKYRIENLAAGRFSLEVFADSCLGGSRSGIEVKEGEATSKVDFELGMAYPLKGTVTRKADGAPVADAEVVVNLVITGPFGEIPFAPSKVKTQTEADGTFEIDRLKEGRMSISVIHPEYGKLSKSGIKIEAGKEPEHLKIELLPGGRVRGTVRDAKGKGVAGDYVVIQNPMDPSNRATLESGPDGTYESELLTPGTYQVIRVDGKDTSKVKVKFQKIKPGETITVDFGELPGCRLHGKVYEGSKAMAGVNVSIIGIEESAETQTELGVSVTNEKGEYDIRSVQPGSYFLFVQTGQIEGSGRARTVKVRIDVDEGSRDIETDIEFPTGAVAGAVRDEATGEPLSGATVLVMRADAPDARSFEEIINYYSGQALSDAKGAFEVGALEPGKYKITVVKDGYATENLGARELRAGQVINLIISLVGEARVTGRVTDVDGNNVENAAFFLMDRDRKVTDFTFGNTFSDAKGQFEVRGVKEGDYTLRVQAERYASAWSKPFSVHQGGSLELNFTLRPEGRIIVTVVKAGAPVKGAVVRVYDPAGTEVFVRLTQKNMYTISPSPKTDGDGRHRIGRLSGGSYRVEVTGTDGVEKSVNVMVDPGGESAVQVDLAE